MADESRNQNGTTELVETDAACPACGERRLPFLPQREDESVDCRTCGRHFLPPGVAACECARANCHGPGACENAAIEELGDEGDYEILCAGCAEKARGEIAAGWRESGLVREEPGDEAPEGGR